ncbi:SDR family oxidoreductase [Pseudanabaena yagii]|uniref:SDR family oxidoreductase n=1 Tax=Pseudanabaena yagii GIHE-NHR1 TaxID=2722753 RepID=A0ABX1LVH7_9CYAN|nr:SDR family oxidoreductase [Pseudanabaena yagii]NMF59021.1 SDR family oxidoreductase [Pseudanabaena yagii GIHE-NHR1]
MLDLKGKIALITGASRGIGAAVAQLLAERGADIIINYRSKAHRAEEIAANVMATGQRAVLAQADITNEEEVGKMMQNIATNLTKLDLLVLNASGGMEKDKSTDYAMDLNLKAQERLADLAVLLMKDGGRIVFVTSHLAHFYGQKPVSAIYENVAASKYAGEQSLRDRIPKFTEKGIRLVVVSGDLIEGTITPKLMERANRGFINERREQAGTLPTVADFATAIADACANKSLRSGETIFVGSTEW